MNAVWGLAVGALIVAAMTFVIFVLSIFTGQSNVARHAALKAYAIGLAVLSAIALSTILVYHRLLVGITDFLFAVLPSLLSLALCGAVIWRARRAMDTKRAPNSSFESRRAIKRRAAQLGR